MNASEYLPPESEHPDNSSNGHATNKVFRLAPVESPEEARKELIKENAPKLRRRVREDNRLSAPAKFLFYCLFDDCFWHKAGGHGSGRIFSTLKGLSERYGHDKDSIARWRDELVAAEWLWCNHQWPMTEYRLTPLFPAPDSSPHQNAVQMSLGQAAKPDPQEVNRKMPLTPPNGAKPQVSARTAAPNGRAKPQDAARATAPIGSRDPKMPLVERHPTVGLGGRMPLHSPTGGDAVTAGCGHTDTQDAASLAASDRVSHSIDARPVDQSERREISPGVRRSGDQRRGRRTAPPSIETDPEKILWNGRHWWASQLYKVLALFDREIVGKEGTERRELTTKRNTLLIALGVKSPTAKTPSPPVPTPQRAPLASPEQLKVYVAELRKAVVGTAR